MNYFEMLDRGRKAALYAYLHAQARAQNFGRATAAGGAPTKQEPAPPPPDPYEDYTDVSSVEQLTEMLNDPETLEVKATITESIEVVGDQPLVVEPGKTLMLNLEDGVKITASGATDAATKDCVIAVKNGATLVIDGNGSVEVEGANTRAGSQYTAIKVTANGADYDPSKTAKLVINGGTFVGKYYAIAGNGSRANTDITINGGKFIGTEPNDNCAIFNPQANSKLTINGGEFEGAMCVVLKSGKMSINGGTFKANGTADPYKYSGNGFNNTGVCLMVDSCGYPGDASFEVDVAGGDFTSENSSAFGSYYTKKKENQPPRLTGFVQQGKVKVTEAIASEEDVYA